MHTMDEQQIKLAADALSRPTSDITGINILKKGMTNRSYIFSCGNGKYIFRIPGEGTAELIDREKEYAVYQAIGSLNICEDVVYIDPGSGYKITAFWDNARVCDPLNFDDVSTCMAALRRFHCMKLEVPHTFDVLERILYFESLLSSPSCFPDHSETTAAIKELADWVGSLSIPQSLAHIDAVHDNFLFLDVGSKDDVRLIDWEYAGMQDPHIDIAMFAVYAMYEREQAERLIECYFPEGCTDRVRLKIYAYIAMCGLLWSNWCEYKRQKGVELGEYALRQYAFAKEYSQLFRSYR